MGRTWKTELCLENTLEIVRYALLIAIIAILFIMLAHLCMNRSNSGRERYGNEQTQNKKMGRIRIERANHQNQRDSIFFIYFQTERN